MTEGVPFRITSFGISDQGLVRDSNEDRFVIAELTRILTVQDSNLPQAKSTPSGHKAYVLIVADGVGGKAAGEVASGLSIVSVESFLLNSLKRFSNLQASEEQGALKELQRALCQADSRIFEETATHPEWHGMATTMTFALAVNWRLFVAHVGDCRCYLYAQGALQQITQDHTFTAEMVRAGVMAPEFAASHPYRNVVTNILGGDTPGVSVELHSLDLHPEDRILICSDGLTDAISEDRIAQILSQELDSKRACERLVDKANQQGGKDNITVVVSDVDDCGA